MAARKKQPASRKQTGSQPDRTLVLLERIEEQNRATYELVKSEIGTLRAEFAARFDALEARVSALEAAVRQNSADIRLVQQQVIALTAKVETLAERKALDALEARVARIEQRLGL